MITAEELLQQERFYAVTSGDEHEIINAMVEFAKMHVEAALEEANNKATTKYMNAISGPPIIMIDEDSILNAYPLTNIK